MNQSAFADQSAAAVTRSRPRPALTFLIDSREQLAFEFRAPQRREFADGGTKVIALAEGDYSCSLDDGAPLSVRLERKSLSDLYGCIGHGRERFERELLRLTGYEYRAIVIESSLLDVLGGFPQSAVHPNSAIGSLCAWSVRYGLGVWFADSHQRAGAIAQKLLEAAAVEVMRRQIVNEVSTCSLVT